MTYEDVVLAIVTYNAESTIEWVLGRIPTDFARTVGAILVSDDGSSDNTIARARDWARSHPDVNVVIQSLGTNRGYGGNQKACYQWTLDHGYGAAVMIHGDGQYAPEMAQEMARPLVERRLVGPAYALAVFGSRMLLKGGARSGGMPLYKWLGNRVLTSCQNRVAGMRLSEWHTGYRAYSAEFLRRLPFESMSDGFDFDTEIILHARRFGAPIHEIAIPTYYGDEKCHVNGLRYAADVMVDVLRYRATRSQESPVIPTLADRQAA